MKTIKLERATLEISIRNIRHDRIVVTRNGKPLALVVGVEGLDEEQLELGSSDKFWKLVEKWRKEKTISRTELERKLAGTKERPPRKQRKSGASRKKQMA